MRPFILDPLFQSIQRLTGIGPRFAKVLERLTGPCVVDLLFHLPIAAIDRRNIQSTINLESGMLATVKGRVTSIILSERPGRPSKITLSDTTGALDLVFFKNPGNYLQKTFPLGKEVVVSGRIDMYQGRPQMPHPDKISDTIESVAKLEPIYPMTAGITASTLSKAIQSATHKIPKLPEWLASDILARHQWPSWQNAMQNVHNFDSVDVLSPVSPVRQRLAYDELLSHQLALCLTREKQRNDHHSPLITDGKLKEKLLSALPFSLTVGQKNVLSEIEEDLKKPNLMCRLLQGDVGSGKTIVALMAASHVIACGKQAAIMAPTEILARQHYLSLKPLADKVGIRVGLLTAREKGKIRELLLEQLGHGDIDFLIGTHALIQDPVQFRDLGLVIIDEQHRFGVSQRLSLASKGPSVNILVMTATPIPRTLALTSYGDMDVSILREKPPGRKPIDTRILSMDKMPELISALKRKIAEGDRIYWVCPLVEESELIDLSAAQDRFTALDQIFPNRVGLVHGRMKGAEKDEMMAKMANGDIDILVATTVIEVGVNIVEATVMIIEHAERFGLSQLHQLRGRVGRGDKAGTCLLLYHGPLGKIAKQRLEIMRQTEDGFEIAERDLLLRGPGDILGTQQSGEMLFRLAKLEPHQELLHMAHQEAKLILNKDPHLTSERGKALRILLYLFERDQADRFLSAG